MVLRDVTKARDADAAREAFLGVLSHELRTPVTAIFGYAKVLQRPTQRDDQAELLSDIEVEADRLYRIVEDLLALSRVEGGLTIEGEPLLIQHLAGPVVASEARRWDRIDFSVDLPVGLPAVFGERTYVEQVLRNLVSNAGKYSPDGSAVVVSAAATPSEVEVTVVDRGSGVRPTRPNGSSTCTTAPRRRLGKRPAPGSGCTSAADSSRRWAGGSGRGRDPMAAPSSGSACRAATKTRRAPMDSRFVQDVVRVG